MIKAIIFDMDGLLIDSEPLWQEAEIAAFAGAGISLTREMCRQTMGMRIDEVIEYWAGKHPQLEQAITRAELKRDVHHRLLQLIRSRGEALPGAEAALQAAQQMQLPLALASSSDRLIIDAVLEKLEINSSFAVIHSAEDEHRGKPHPAVYQTTARLLDVPPPNCLAVEDSVNGLKSAKSAGMRCALIPEKGVGEQPDFRRADYRFESLLAFAESLPWILQSEASRAG